MLIDGRCVAISDAEYDDARDQLGLPSSFHLVEASGYFNLDTGDQVIQIPLPNNLVVGAFEDPQERRRYGVIKLKSYTCSSINNNQ